MVYDRTEIATVLTSPEKGIHVVSRHENQQIRPRKSQKVRWGTGCV